MYIHKNGVTLKKAAKSDLSWMLKCKNEAWFAQHNSFLLNEEDQQKWYEGLTSSSLMLVHETIGLYKIAAINGTNRSADVGWDIVKSHRGKGYGTKIGEAGTDFCFEILNLNRLSCEILAYNTYCIKMVAKVGYTLEGCKRKAVYKFGRYVDSLIYGITKDDWLSKNKGICSNNIPVGINITESTCPQII